MAGGERERGGEEAFKKKIRFNYLKFLLEY